MESQGQCCWSLKINQKQVTCHEVVKIGHGERGDTSAFGDVKLMSRYALDQELLAIANIHQPKLKQARARNVT
jgi:hypothetical protein